MLRVAAQGIGCVNNMLKFYPSLMMKTNSRVELNHQNTKVKLSISILLIMYFLLLRTKKATISKKETSW